MFIDIVPEQVENLGAEEQRMLQKLLNVYNAHASKNADKEKYYEGHIKLGDVNLGIALPEGMSKLEIGCAWGAKCVDVLAARSMFDGYVGLNGAENALMAEIVENNRLVAEYIKACRDELKYGCTFATLSADPALKCKIRFHSPQTAAAVWNGDKGRIDYGFAVIDTVPANEDNTLWEPSLINLYTERAIWVLERDDYSAWHATPHAHKMRRPLMEAMVWNATSNKPFGRSRIKEPIRRLIDGYVRTIANATIGLEFSTAPQKYLLGVTDEQYDVVVNNKFKQYVGNILASTVNPETGEKPSYGQLPQGNISPHVEMIRILATQFSAATGLTVTDTGVVSEANPTSADAVIAQSQTLILMAEEINVGNGDALKTIARMALAIAKNTTLDGLTDDDMAIMAHFKNPAMPSVAAMADAALKIASVRQGFANTDVFAEMNGFDPADIRRINAQESRARGLDLVAELESTE